MLAAPSIHAASTESTVAIVLDESDDVVVTAETGAAAGCVGLPLSSEDDEDDVVDEGEEAEAAVVAGLVDSGGGLIDCFSLASRCAKRDSTEGPTLPPATALAETVHRKANA